MSNATKARVKINPLFIVGLFVGMLVAAILWVLLNMPSPQKISCFEPETAVDGSPYCVYYSEGALFAAGNSLHIGSSDNRGLFYKVPYDLNDIEVSWNDSSGDVAIQMPGTEINIERNEYVDLR